MARTDSAELSAGDVVADYRIEGAISQGAMGAVYKASDSDGKCVAVKRLIDPRHAVRFEIEARLLAQLEHPRVVKVVDHYHDSTGNYLIMQMVDGPDLGRVLETRGSPGLSVRDAIAYVLEACQALQYVHDQQVVHRDVKPQNMILSADGVVLVDFGIARQVDYEDPGTRAIGTPRFMAPEVLVGDVVSPRCDVYGLAATLWTLITGKPPALQDGVRLVEQFDGVTSELERTLRAGLELHPERRIASIAAFARALGSPLGISMGASLALSLPGPEDQRKLIEAIVHTAAGVFEAAAASIALVDEVSGELVYTAAWGAGAKETVGMRLASGAGLAGSVIAAREGIAVPDCRSDPRFAAQMARGTGYVPNTMILMPLERDGATIGVLSILDRRDGQPYMPADLVRAGLFAELAVAAMPS
jgi:tRNA A-37 threonylcarbamoyl transferase component Bud32